MEFRNLVDWDYYTERLAGQIQKIIVIPAYFQHVPIELTEVQPPAWILKLKTQDRSQRKLSTFTNFFSKPRER